MLRGAGGEPRQDTKDAGNESMHVYLKQENAAKCLMPLIMRTKSYFGHKVGCGSQVSTAGT